MQFNFYVIYFAIILATLAGVSFLTGDVEKYVTLTLQIMNSVLIVKGISDNKNPTTRDARRKFKY